MIKFGLVSVGTWFGVALVSQYSWIGVALFGGIVIALCLILAWNDGRKDMYRGKERRRYHD